MSFGYEHDQPVISDAINVAATERKVLLFAAASNRGGSGRVSLAYPASDNHVICINSAAENGFPSTHFNPNPPEEDRNLSTLGESVRSAWPQAKFPADHTGGYIKQSSGTSTATPIAAASAALLMEFVRQQPQTVIMKNAAKEMKKYRYMKFLLKRMAKEPYLGFRFIEPGNLLDIPGDFSADGFTARVMIETQIYLTLQPYVDLTGTSG